MDQLVDRTIREYLVAALRKLSSDTPELSFAEVPIPRFGDSLSGGLTAQVERVPRADWHVTLSAPLLEGLPEARAAAQELVADARFRGVAVAATREEQVKVAEDALLRLVMAYVRRNASFEFRDAVAAELLMDFEGVWLSATVDHVVIMPLLSCDIGVAAIGLDNAVALATLTPDVKRALWRPASVFGDVAVAPHDLATAGCALFGGYESTDPMDHMACRPIALAMDRAVLALRLLKAGGVYPAAMFDRVVPGGLCDGSSEMHVGDWRPGMFVRPPYHLDTTEVSALRELYIALSELEARPVPHGLEESLQQFTRLYAHLFAEDQVKGLATALETPLLSAPVTKRLGGAKGEPLARRGARLISSTHDEATSAELLLVLYKVRNPVTHEGKSVRDCAAIMATAGVTPDDLVPRATELVRAILREFVRRVAQNDRTTAADIAAGLAVETHT
jgi:hypothetical protein